MRDRRALAVLLGGLAAANVVRSTIVPDRWHLPLNLAVGAGALGLGVVAGLGRADLGAGPGWIGRGLRTGGPVALAIAAGAAGLALAPLTAGVFEDARGDISGIALARRALLVIPIGTVLVEEIAFRGVLHGLARRVLAARPAVLLGALAFGLWHVLPAVRAADPGRGVAVGAGTFAVTAIAGAGIVWLRARSDSLLAPILVHIGLNSSALVAAWIAMRGAA